MKRIGILLLTCCMALSAAGCARRTASYEFNLPCNPTTGYDWVIADVQQEEKTGKVNVTLEYRPDETAADYVGGGGSTVGVVTGVTPGDASVTLCYVRAWEWDGDPATAEYYAVYDFKVNKDLTLSSFSASMVLPESVQ